VKGGGFVGLYAMQVRRVWWSKMTGDGSEACSGGVRVGGCVGWVGHFLGLGSSDAAGAGESWWSGARVEWGERGEGASERL